VGSIGRLSMDTEGLSLAGTSDRLSEGFLEGDEEGESESDTGAPLEVGEEAEEAKKPATSEATVGLAEGSSVSETVGEGSPGSPSKGLSDCMGEKSAWAGVPAGLSNAAT
jgi:hypothetical protein